MKRLFILAMPIIGLLCTAIRCADKEGENCHLKVKISNNSQKKLRVNYDICNIKYPCGIGSLSYTAKGEMYLVGSNEQNNDWAISQLGCIENLFNREGSSGILNIYIFDAEVIENTPWETVVRDYLVLKRYDLSLSDLQRLDWLVTYPPTEAMKDIQQWPEYGSD